MTDAEPTDAEPTNSEPSEAEPPEAEPPEAEPPEAEPPESEPPESEPQGKEAEATVPVASPRMLSLDVLRALAVLLVLGAHFPTGVADIDSPILREVLKGWHRGGGIGVDLFFVLSGFLVSGLLLRQHQRDGKLSIWRFLTRRAFRIYPPFYTLMAITFVVCWVLDIPLDPRKVLGEMVYLQNYLGALWGHTWTLAVEEHFYLLLPFLLLLVLGRGNAGPFGRLPWVCAFFAVVCLGLRFSAEAKPPPVAATHLRIDSLLAGVFLAYLYQYRPTWLTAWSSRRRRIALVVVSLVLIAPAFVGRPPGFHTVGLTVLYVGFSGFLVAALGTHLPASRPWRFLAFIGQHSYSIYLWHFGVRLVCMRSGLEWAPEWGSAWLVIYFVGAILVGIGMAKVVELPMLRVRDRWFPSRSGALAQQAG